MWLYFLSFFFPFCRFISIFGWLAMCSGGREPRGWCGGSLGAVRFLMDPQGLLRTSLHVFILLLLPGRLDVQCIDSHCRFQKLPYPDGYSGQVESGDPESPGHLADSPGGPRNLSCYLVDSEKLYECTWQYDGPLEGVSHFLRCCRTTGSGRLRCCFFEAGSALSLRFSDQDGVPVLSPVKLWVESWRGNQTLKSQEINLHLKDWVKLAPPGRGVDVTCSPGRLLMSWETDKEGTEVQFRRRTPGSAWDVGDCGPQDDVGLESCTSPLQKDEWQEIQIRRRKLKAGVLKHPWSEWRESVCIPPETLPHPGAPLLEEPLESDGRWTLTVQPPQLALPTGCPQEVVRYDLRVHVRSCRCREPTQGWNVTLEEPLRLSGAAHDLELRAHTCFGQRLVHTWHLPAREPQEPTPPSDSVSGEERILHWAPHAPNSTYCVEWQPQGQNDSEAGCVLMEPGNGDSEATAPLSWAGVLAAMARAQCYRLTVFASERLDDPTSWSTVLSFYYFGGNASVAGTPQHVSVRNHTPSSVSVEWAPSLLSTCPGVLKHYVVRWEDEGGRQESECVVRPPETQVNLEGLQAGAAYTVQVRADTAWARGAWSPAQHFGIQVQVSHLPVLLASLGSFWSILLVGVLGYLGLSRAAGRLCPPLPTPSASSAVEFPHSQVKQVWPWLRPEDAPEAAGAQQPLVVEPSAPQDTSTPRNSFQGLIPGPRHWEVQAGLLLPPGDPLQRVPQWGDPWWILKAEEKPGRPPSLREAARLTVAEPAAGY